MADFDLQQTDQQVQNILNDGQSAIGAGAQTTLTTEYVMLKDINGVYHKILKDSLTEACRNVLAGLLVNNDKGTTINQIPAIASGDFGSITPANLASVLGVVGTQRFDNNGAVNIFASAIEDTFQNAERYSKIESTTSTASEGYFVGYKHDYTIGEVVLITRKYTINANLILFVRNSSANDGTWSAYKIV